MVLISMQMTPNCMAIVHLPILLSWRLEFFELLTQFTSGCPQTALSQHWQDSIHLAWYEAQSCQERYRSALQSTSIPDRTYIREESWLHYPPRVKHEGSYHQTLPVVLLSASPNTHGSTLTHVICNPNLGSCLRLHASRFLKQPSLWGKCLPP